MCLKGCSILVLPCTILVLLIAIALGLLIEADRQGVEIPTVTLWMALPLRYGSERLVELLRSTPDDERILSLLAFLDSAPMCSTVPIYEIDSCAEWAGCMLASGMDNIYVENAARVNAVQLIRNRSPDWLQHPWKMTLCGKEFTATQDGWRVSNVPPSHAVAEEQAVEHRRASDDELRDRKNTIKEACIRMWSAYQKLAWGSDELLPLSRIGHRYRGNGLGMFLLDGMETMHLLGEQDAFEYAVAWVASNSSGMPGAFNQAMNIDKSGSWSTAEVGTHVVGGLLSSYQLSGYETLLDAADRVAARLEPAFHTRSGLPLQQCDLSHAVCHRPDSYPHNPRGDATVEETWAGNLELAVLAHVSHRDEHLRHALGQKVAAASRRLLEAIDKRAAGARSRLASATDDKDSLVRTHGPHARLMEQTEDAAAAYGLAGTLIDPDNAEWTAARHTVAYGGRDGSSAERYYSGLLHQYIWWTALASESTKEELTSGTGRSGVTAEEAARLALQCKNRYQSAIEGLRRLLVRRSKGLHKLWYIGELLQGQQFVPAFSSTSCGLSGTLALGHIHGMDDENESHLKLSKRLAESCVRISQLTASGLPPDVSWLNGRPKAHEDAVEWFVPDEDSQRLQQLHAELVVGSTTEENRASSKSAHESTRLRLESAEIVVMRDERGSSACTGGHALAQSLYWLYRATKHQKYVEWGWTYFKALEQSARLPREDAGYGTVSDVTNASSTHRDEMKGWLLTAFKWLWLLQEEAGGNDSGSEPTVPRVVVPSSVGHLLLATRP